MEEDEKPTFLLPQPSHWVAKLISFQADLIYNCLVSVFAPLCSILSMASESYHRAEETKDNVESAVQHIPSNITYGSTLVLKRLGLGFLSAAYVCMLLVLVLILAVVVGVGLVHLWVEEPVFVREKLHFDYTDAHPTAAFSLDGGVGGVEGYSSKKKQIGVPVGHTFYISLVLLMPESDFNRDIGVFQLSAELLSVKGNVIAKSSQPCMLRFRSFPIRLARTFIMGVPVLLGISGETQKINVEILKHKEDNRRTKAIKVRVSPRAGTSSLPQIYEAEIVVNSQLPRAKELVHNWRWTCYVWVSLYIYIMLLMILLCCCRPLMFVVIPEYGGSVREAKSEKPEESEMREGDESEVLRKWRRSRSKRKAILTQGEGGGVVETIGSSASSMSMSMSMGREDVTSTVVEDDVGESESVCLG